MNLVSIIASIALITQSVHSSSNSLSPKSPETNHDSLIYSKYQLLSWSINQLDKDSILPITLKREVRSDKSSFIREDDEDDGDNKEDSERKQRKEVTGKRKLSRRRRERINSRREDQADEENESYSNRISKQKQFGIKSKPIRDENIPLKDQD